MELNLTHASDHEDFRFNGCIYNSPTLSHPLVCASRHAPKNTDALLRPYLYSSTLPTELEHSMKEYVSTIITPGFYGGGIRSRPRWFYANCAVFGMLLGRAFALLGTPTRPPRSLDDSGDFPFTKLPAELRLQIYAYYKEDLAQRQRYWEVMTRVFIKALWSGSEPEEGSRYVTGIIMLSCGHAMSLCAPLLRGRGSRYVWWDDCIKDLDHTWGWSELQDAVFGTKDLPRHNTDTLELYKYAVEVGETAWRNNLEYVSKEVLDVLDLAREHLQADERDWTPPEIEARLMSGLFENDEARKIWEPTGLVPRAFEQKFAMEKTSMEPF
ncbi:hypothetical protein BU26DRAFT_157768 [Trematosphaeria pertusa]|uniref:Uncharacterized protein n=1 Tax=Trematosphaeria pertusa TaxID=390896 RepID=A0A6A6HW62_9PLEO|nr:uncharacterized protein BU26DRAFT_157768 [Trematosphaeria pertusa]KAF2242267.1 hypothetical protein BU26DRAFT_157768 [Trematosphaeria pertusa]